MRHATRVKDGKTHTYWRLVRSVRIGRKVVQQTVAHLGELDAEGRARAKALARAIMGDREQADLFTAAEPPADPDAWPAPEPPPPDRFAWPEPEDAPDPAPICVGKSRTPASRTSTV